ncbi:hypothetical protein N7510_010439 [Penicillium lagena]|uniref:uncharacterized protein n=1 Tax=Penicillium lagena TaxID=94218 RepID=UPI002540230E|nr:uncharacterized protein N7510_010439 [Penicillium lagena]KAJ5605285.1 hypothetical protein N7510_010439 [Penicillium lagena]
MHGLVNLLPNEPDDGGLIVCRGAHLLSEQFYREIADEEQIPAWSPERSKNSRPQFAIYTCYLPDAFDRRVGQTHWPNAKHTGSNIGQQDGKEDPHNRLAPMTEPAFNERTFRLTRISYIREESIQADGDANVQIKQTAVAA